MLLLSVRGSWMRHLCLAIGLAFALNCMPGWETPAAAQRQRLSLNEGWRFHRGDPEGSRDDLRYAVLPAIDARADGADFDAGAMQGQAAAGTPVLQPWILPTGNAFILDSTKRHRRPAAEPAVEVPFAQASFDDRGWQPVTLPHDWAIAGPFLKEGPHGGMGRLPSWGVGWYRRTLDIPASDRGRRIVLEVDGAMSYATVWLNGRLVGGWPFGYASWQVDLTPYVTPGGVNQLAIRLDNPPESSRWYPGGGIYRNLWLTKTAPVHVAQWGSRVDTPEVSAASAKVELTLRVENAGAAPATVTAATEIFAIDGYDRRIGGAVARIAPAEVAVPAGGEARASGSAVIANPRLWGPPPTQKPNRYVAVTTLRQGGRTIDSHETRFGIRSLAFDPARGVIVNGEHVMLNGVNQHHDLGALGAAFNLRAAQRQLEMLADMGANAIRMAHNPPAPELLDLTDRMGMLVMNEAFDVWRMRKTPLDFHLIFDDWHEQDLRALIRRDYNHPSIIMWSVGNEVGEQNAGAAGAELARRLVAIAHQEDATRPAIGSMNYAAPGSPFAAAFDHVALNYQGAGVRTRPMMFAPFREKHPGAVILSSESAAAYSSRGMYQFPVPGGVSNPVRPGVGGDWETQQVSAYELFGADFGGSADRAWSAQDQHPFVAGEFVWTGWDYLGEPAPFYASRSSYFGIIDLAGFPKDRFWAYKARWKPDERFVHILPHWTFPGREGLFTPVHAFTSGDEAELFVNGKSQGRLQRAPLAYRFRWDYVQYAPGELKVVAWKNGKPWAEETIRTAGPPARIVATADRAEIAGDGRDLSFVRVELRDADGNFVPVDTRAVTFRLTGPGELVATDNGDPTDFTAFPSATRNLFSGRALAIVRARHAGAIRLEVAAENLPLASIAILAR